MQEEVVYIINPKSGLKLGSLKYQLFQRRLGKVAPSDCIFYTDYPGHAREIASQALADGKRTVVACGGDGTVNEVGSALVNTDAVLGIIPFGSGNGLARHLKIPVQWEKALKLIQKGQITEIDGGTINDRWFFCTCGVGFDAKIGHKFTKVKKRGFTGYLKLVLSEFNRYKARKYKFTVDGEKYSRRAFVVSVANASQYGNNAYIAPHAKIDDGVFDVCIIRPFPAYEGFNLGLKLFNKTIMTSKFYESFEGRKIVFKKRKKKLNFHYDGEAIKFKNEKVKIEIHEKVLKVITPVPKSMSRQRL